jgi:hypothetical protein
MAAVGTKIVYEIEKRSRANRISHIDALKDEMAAAKGYMTKPEPISATASDS